jgi:hypothetical protein
MPGKVIMQSSKKNNFLIVVDVIRCGTGAGPAAVESLECPPMVI